MNHTRDGEIADHRENAPKRSLTQRLDALERANHVRTRHVRTQRAKLKKDLKTGSVKIHALLTDPPDYVTTAKVFDMLLAVPGYGGVKANKILAHCRISPSKTICGLSPRQRDELSSLLQRSDRDEQQAARAAIPGVSSPASTDAEEQDAAPANAELLCGLERLLEEARQVGRRAARAAGAAGVKIDASASKPDSVGLQVALTRTLTPPVVAAAGVAPPGVSDDPPQATTAVALATSPRAGHAEIFNRANEVRLAHARLKRQVSEGTMTVGEVILARPPEAVNMTIVELLQSERRWSATRCRTLLESIGIPATRTIGSLTERQRRLLASML